MVRAPLAAHDGSVQSTKTEPTMTLDDVYGSELDKFPLEQDAANWDADTLGLDWDETEVSRLASELSTDRFNLH